MRCVFKTLLFALRQCDMVSDVCYRVSGTQRCVNTDPGFHCLPCPKRYKGNQPFGMGVEAAKKNKQVRRFTRLLSWTPLQLK